MKEDTRQRTKSGAKPDVRLALIGAPKVGKSAISVRFLTRRFIHEYQRSVEHTYRRNLEFGNEVIEYVLRDSSGTVENNNNLIHWASCVAVIYSISDKNSFNVASALLEEINFIYNSKNYKQNGPKSIGLIGNKKDLNHLREVSLREAKELANKHGANFWEVSASDDFHSTHAPLNSMVVEAYLNNLTLKTVKGGLVSPGSHVKGLDENIRNELISNQSIESDEGGLQPSTPFKIPMNPFDFSSEKRKSFKDRKKLDLKLNQLKSESLKKISMGRTSLDNDNFDSNNNTNSNSPDTMSLSTDNDEPIRTSSWSKKDKKRKEKSKESKELKELKEMKLTEMNGVGHEEIEQKKSNLQRCHSLTDLKSLEKEHHCEGVDSENKEDIEPHDVEDDKLTDLISPSSKITSSFSRLSSYSAGSGVPIKSPRPRKERRKTTGLTMTPEHIETDLASPRSPEPPREQSRFKRAE
eukprot:TCONS_00068771-protein